MKKYTAMIEKATSVEELNNILETARLDTSVAYRTWEILKKKAYLRENAIKLEAMHNARIAQ